MPILCYEMAMDNNLDVWEGAFFVSTYFLINVEELLKSACLKVLI